MLRSPSYFRLASLRPDGSVQWHEPVPETGPGVYVVSIADPESVIIPHGYEAERGRWGP